MKAARITTVVGLVLAVSAPAWALDFLTPYSGPIKFKFSSWNAATMYTNLYGPGGELGADNVEYGVADLDALTQTGAMGAYANEDAWFIFQVSSVRTDTAANQLLWADGTAGEAIVGIGYGLRDVGLYGTPALQKEIIYSDNLHLKVFVQPELDGSGDEYFDVLQGTAGRTAFDLYNGIGDLDGDGDFDAADQALGATLLVEGVGITGISTKAGVPALDDHLDALPAYEHVFMESSLLSHAYVDAIGGQWGDGNVANGEFVPSQFLDPVTLDHMDTTELMMTASSLPYIQVGANDDWDLKSEDPVRGDLVPEPATIALAAVGMAGLVGRRKRRRR